MDCLKTSCLNFAKFHDICLAALSLYSPLKDLDSEQKVEWILQTIHDTTRHLLEVILNKVVRKCGQFLHVYFLSF